MFGREKGTDGRVAMDSDERVICSRWRSRSDMVVVMLVVRGVYLGELVFYLRVVVVATEARL